MGLCFLIITGMGADIRPETRPPKLKESWKSIVVKAEAPIPEEIKNQTQAKALSREAAIVIGQNRILSYILEKKTKSGRPLKVAEVPSLDLQGKIRGMVKDVKISSTRWKEGWCQVKLILKKKDLKKILKNN